MEKQAKQNLSSFIKGLSSSVDYEENTTLELVKNGYSSIYEIISDIRNYIKSMKCTIFNKVIDLLDEDKINIREFKKIINSLNVNFDDVQEFIDDNFLELYDRDLSVFRELYYQLYCSISIVYQTIIWLK
ncbi:MAG: hypothetical protein MSH19_05020 [Methanobrevibacter smithii]|nr:hypothetical protein [Methanobrevibacter smithii]MCI7355455.1 hypothetical protein [Methanobrevibacter smithii]